MNKSNLAAFSAGDSCLRVESWRRDGTGLCVRPPASFEIWGGELNALVTTKTAGNMQEEAERTRLARRLDIDASHLALSYQAHEKEIHIMKRPEDVPLNRVGGIDGWAAGKASGVSLGIFGADCLPLFLISLDRPIGALLHVGWRGLDRGIVENGVRVLESVFNVPAARLAGLAGPHIRNCCYEVGEDVALRFPVEWTDCREGKKFLSLDRGVCAKLRQSGVDWVMSSADCTRCSDPSLFFSYRRQDKGSQLALLMFS
ncbi:MAG: laccase domain-containing protein [Elusimicrobiota bacterium]